MPVLTPGHQLPTVIGSDRPCDVTDTLCALRARINVLLNSYDNTINRTVTAVPAAMMWRAIGDGTVGVSPDIVLPFTRVGIDTDNMINLAADARKITIQRPGFYMLAANARIFVSGIQNTQEFGLYLQGGFSSSADTAGSTISRIGIRTFCSIADMRQCFEGDTLSVLASSTDDPNGTQIEESYFAAYWVADGF